MRPLRVMRGIIITWCPSLLIVCKLLHVNLFSKTTGPIVLKDGRSVHLIVLKKVFSSPGPTVQMSFSHHFVSVICHPLTFRILIFSRTTRSNWTKLWCDTLWMLLFQKCVRWPCLILKMAAMSSDWLNNWKSLKIFFRTTGWIETKFSQNAGTAHPLEQMRASSNQIIVFTQLEIYKLQSVVSCNYTPLPKGGGGILFYLCPSFCLSNIFFVAFFSVTVDGRNLIFGHKRHIGIPYCG